MTKCQPSIPDFDPRTDYFDETFKLSFQNDYLCKEYDSLLKEVQELWIKIQKREKRAFGVRHRRKNVELKKFFECPRSDCKKKYAYRSSLIMHLKRKHRSPFD